MVFKTYCLSFHAQPLLQDKLFLFHHAFDGGRPCCFPDSHSPPPCLDHRSFPPPLCHFICLLFINFWFVFIVCWSFVVALVSCKSISWGSTSLSIFSQFYFAAIVNLNIIIHFICASTNTIGATVLNCITWYCIIWTAIATWLWLFTAISIRIFTSYISLWCQMLTAKQSIPCYRIHRFMFIKVSHRIMLFFTQVLTAIVEVFRLAFSDFCIRFRLFKEMFYVILTFLARILIMSLDTAIWPVSRKRITTRCIRR